jgi:hypothetical protein
MGVVGRFREDVAHDAASELPAPLILLLRDAHLEPWLNICPMLPVHVVLTSFPCGHGSNADAETADDFRLAAPSVAGCIPVSV